LDSSKHLDEKNQSYETGEEIGPPEASAAFVGVASEDCKAGVIPNNSVWNRNLLNRCVDTKNGALSAEHLLNFRLQMRIFRCGCEVTNANKTNENRSVRTGQGELANRRIQPLCHLSAACFQQLTTLP
jgi:hypothetical protein